MCGDQSNLMMSPYPLQIICIIGSNDFIIFKSLCGKGLVSKRLIILQICSGRIRGRWIGRPPYRSSKKWTVRIILRVTSPKPMQTIHTSLSPLSSFILGLFHFSFILVKNQKYIFLFLVFFLVFGWDSISKI